MNSVSWVVAVVVAASVRGQGNRIMDTSASCDANNIYFRLNFQAPFRGVIYTENQWPNCVYVNGSADPKQSYDVVIPLRSCNTVRLNPSGAWENAVIVQSDPRVLESSDRKFLLNCHPGAGPQDSSFTVSFGGVTVQSALSSTDVVTGAGAGGGAAALDYTVEIQVGRGPGGGLVRRPLSVGEPISYVVRVPDTRGSDVRIGACWARDGVSNIQLSDERGCSVQDTGNNIWNTFQSSSDGRGKTFWNDIRAWAFPTSDRVDIFCNLHLCTGACPALVCGRGRRDVGVSGESAEDSVPVEGSFQVSNLAQIDVLNAEFKGRPSALGVNVVTGDPERVSGHLVSVSDICINRIHFGIGLGLMLVVGLILVVGSVVYAVRVCHKRRAKSGVWAGEGGDAVIYERPLRRTQLPRAHAALSTRVPPP